MKIIWKTGRGTSTFKADSNAFVEALTKKLSLDVSTTEIERTQIGIKRLGEKLVRTADREMKKLIPFISLNMIGTVSTFRGAEFSASTFNRGLYREARLSKDTRAGVSVRANAKPGLGSITWPALSQKTIKKKRANKDKFYLHRGTLRRFFQNNAAKILAGIGQTQVKVETKSTAASKTLFRVGSITVKIALNVYPNRLPGLRSGRWADFNKELPLERGLRFPQPILKKLAGPTRGDHNIRHRPLLQPALGFWIMHRIPSVLADAVLQG